MNYLGLEKEHSRPSVRAPLDGYGSGVSGPGGCSSSPALSPQMVPVRNPGVALAPQLCSGQSVAGATGLGLMGHRVPKRAGQDREGEAFPQVRGPD